MGSSIAWLDTTAEEQRIARELIALFTQTESRDELGIGQIRDAFSDSLFPGTSVIQTRARYFLFVPWCYRDGKARGTSGERCRVRGERQERQLIATFLRSRDDGELDDVSGLIGIRAGTAVKTLPSTIYWGALFRYGILTFDTDRSHLGLREPAEPDPATELANREVGDWTGGLPQAPEGFPEQIPGGFDLTYEEAAWLADRITMTTEGSALSHLLARRELIPEHAAFPWEAIPESQFGVLHHARMFSTVMHGASLLYNLLVAERYEQDPQLTQLDSLVDLYRDRLEEWADASISPILEKVRSWDVDQMWQTVATKNSRIHPATRLFINAWITAVKHGKATSAGADQGLRQLVHQREARKGSQSRLVNGRMLATWSGASGAGQLAYRWGNVRVLVNDVMRGLQSDVAS